MEFQKLEAVYKGIRFIIEEDYPNVGAYLYVYTDNICIKDSLQNTVNDCIEIALEEYGVPITEWVKIK